ncbi:MAG: DUF6485 family protein [Ruthenibacterium lactatiformans]
MSAEPVNHDRGCTPCIGKCLREGGAELLFQRVGPLPGTGRGLYLSGLCTACAGGGAALHGGPRQAARSRCNLRRRKQEHPQDIFSGHAAAFHAGCGRGTRWDEKQRPDTSRPLFFLCGKSYFCITAPSFAPDTSFA